MFLSPEWVEEAVKVVQGARSRDEEFRKLTSDYSLSLAYVTTEIPPKLMELYSSNQLVLLIELENGVVRRFEILKKLPEEKIDFTVISSYSVVKKIFSGELSLASGFFNRQLKVEPFRELYWRPRFTARSILVGNKILKFCREIPTRYL